MRAIDPTMRQSIVFKVLYYRYYNFDLDQPFQLSMSRITDTC